MILASLQKLSIYLRYSLLISGSKLKSQVFKLYQDVKVTKIFMKSV